jgi:hypothetical protein
VRRQQDEEAADLLMQVKETYYISKWDLLMQVNETYYISKRDLLYK